MKGLLFIRCQISLLFVLFAFGPENLFADSDYSTVVRFEVRGERDISERAKRMLLEEISKIDDVRVRNKGQIFGFKVLISAIRPPKNKKVVWGYAATLIVERYPGVGFIDRVEAVLGASPEGKAYEELSRQVLERGVMHFASMKVVPKDNLNELSRELVALFDKEVLDPDRKRFKELMILEEKYLIQKDKEDKQRKIAEEAAEKERKLQEEQAKKDQAAAAPAAEEGHEAPVEEASGH